MRAKIVAITPGVMPGEWNVHRADGTTDRNVPWSDEMTAYAAGLRRVNSGRRMCPAR